jgi:putative membrane protein
MRINREPPMVDVARSGRERPGGHPDYAEHRTLLANERNYAAWVRTGLTALAAGIAFEKFIPGTIPDWSVRLIAVILILFSAACFWLALWRYRHLGVRFPHLKAITISLPLITTFTLLLIVASLLALVGLWMV